jgi:hypothetical protein
LEEKGFVFPLILEYLSLVKHKYGWQLIEVL